MSNDDLEDLREGKLVWLGGVLLFWLVVVAYYISSYFGESGLDALGITLSAILTGGLVYLYREHATIQNDQKKILENQEGLMEADIRPVLDVEMFTPWGRSFERRSPNSITVGLRNVGRGVARTPHLRIDLEIDSDEFEGETYRLALTRVRGKNEPYEGLSGNLRPNGESRKFTTAMMLNYEGGNNSGSVRFQEGIQRFNDSNISTIELEFFLETLDIDNELHDFKILEFYIDIENYDPDERMIPYSFLDIFTYSLGTNAIDMADSGTEATIEETSNITTSLTKRLTEESIEELAENEYDDIDQALTEAGIDLGGKVNEEEDD